MDITMPHEFVSETVALYHKARKPLYPLPGRLFRGESRSVASEVEDLFAHYLGMRLQPDTTLFVNQTLTSGAKSERQRIKPDIVLARGGAIRALVDLKMDLGYKRDQFLPFWKDWDSRIPLLRGCEFSLWRKVDSVRERLTLRFDTSAKLFFVLVSDLNINPRDLAPILQHKGNMEHSDVFVLTHEVHPNDYRGMSPKVDDAEFASLEKVLSQA